MHMYCTYYTHVVIKVFVIQIVKLNFDVCVFLLQLCVVLRYLNEHNLKSISVTQEVLIKALYR